MDKLHVLGHYAACHYAQELQDKWAAALKIVRAEAREAEVELTLGPDLDTEDEHSSVGASFGDDSDLSRWGGQTQADATFTQHSSPALSSVRTRRAIEEPNTDQEYPASAQRSTTSHQPKSPVMPPLIEPVVPKSKSAKRRQRRRQAQLPARSSAETGKYCTEDRSRCGSPTV